MKEFIIWGVPANKESEEVLISEKANLKNLDQAKKACQVLENKYKCKNTRIQTIDFKKPLNFVESININL